MVSGLIFALLEYMHSLICLVRECMRYDLDFPPTDDSFSRVLAPQFSQPQNEHIELWQKRHGKRLDFYEKKRKREARAVHDTAKMMRSARGIRAKLIHQKRYKEKIQMKKT